MTKTEKQDLIARRGEYLESARLAIGQVVMGQNWRPIDVVHLAATAIAHAEAIHVLNQMETSGE